MQRAKPTGGGAQHDARALLGAGVGVGGVQTALQCCEVKCVSTVGHHRQRIAQR
jgi:hypothetical protein